MVVCWVIQDSHRKSIIRQNKIYKIHFELSAMKFKYLSLVVWAFCSSAFAQNFVENTDITDQVNAELVKNKTVSIPSGDFKIDANKSIQPPSGSSIKMQSGTRLFVIPNRHDSSRVFKVSNVNNVKITGGQLIGDKYTHLNGKGEWGMGVEIRDSQNISVSNMKISKMWGDGIYIATNGANANKNITLSSLTMNDNRRQGITITSVDTLNASNIRISNTGGTNPANAVDIEPNNNKAVLRNINFNGLTTYDNAGVGFQVSLKHYNNSPKPISISLRNHNDNGSNFGFVINGLTSPVKGSIDIDGVKYKTNKKNNFCFNSWQNNVTVNVRNISYDKENTFPKHSWCLDYNQESKIKISRAQ